MPALETEILRDNVKNIEKQNEILKILCLRPFLNRKLTLDKATVFGRFDERKLTLDKTTVLRWFAHRQKIRLTKRQFLDALVSVI